MSFLDPTIPFLIEETEYTPYWDLLQLLKRDYNVVRSNASTVFVPTLTTTGRPAPTPATIYGVS